MKTLTKDERELIARALEILPDASPEDREAIFEECTGGHDDRVILIETLHETLASACVHQGEVLQGQYELYIKHAGQSEQDDPGSAAENYRFALLACAQIISAETYTEHHTVITDEEALKVAQSVIDKQFPSGIKSRAEYEAAEIALSDAIDAID